MKVVLRSLAGAMAAVTLAACGPEAAPEQLAPGDVGETEQALRPVMRMPFPCGQVWTASTWSGHNPWQAVDFNRTNDLGDTVVASAAGTVMRVENTGADSYGKWIEIGHGDGWRTRYAHLSVQSVQVGQTVRMGQKIGEVGSTGGSSGPHLHYEQLLNGSPVKVILGATEVGYYEKQNYTSHNGC